MSRTFARFPSFKFSNNKMDVGQKLRRMRHNLVSSSKKNDDDEELKVIQNVENRNAKISSTIGTFRKDLSATIRTGFKEENIDKRKKKLEEIPLAANMKDASVDLEYMQSSCLWKIFNRLATSIHCTAEEQVKHELTIERRVYDELQVFCDSERAYHKGKEKLANAQIDLQIAQKSLDKEATSSHQEAVDSAHLTFENLKDATITEAFELSSKELQVAMILKNMVEMKVSFFKLMMAEYAQVLPEIQAYIDAAKPRPVYETDLTEHVRHNQTRISLVIEKCCTLLRSIGFAEKGLFRVNGNNARVKRIKAAFDSGQFDADERFYHYDPHSVCSALKLYLRELPDRLLTKELQKDWVAAIRLDGEQRLIALEACIDKLPISHRDNLTYLMHFLSDLTAHEQDTSMNASSIGIVFGPNLMETDLGCKETNGAKIVEILIVNAHRLFGIPQSNSNFYDFPRKENNELTPQLQRNLMNPVSPRVIRPKERAPPPPPALENSIKDVELIDFADNANMQEANDGQDFSDEWSDGFSSGPPSQQNSLSRSYTEKRPHRPPPPSYRSSGEVLPQGRPISYHIAVGGNTVPSKNGEQFVKQNALKVMSAPTAPDRKRQSIIGLMSSSSSTRSQSSSASHKPADIIKPTTVTDGGDNRTLVSVEDDPIPTTSMPKPPLPIKPKDLGDKESSRL